MTKFMVTIIHHVCYLPHHVYSAADIHAAAKSNLLQESCSILLRIYQGSRPGVAGGCAL